MKGDNKGLRNVRSTEVDLQLKTKDDKASRTSWADIYKESIAVRKSATLLGKKIEADDSLEWRVKWGQHGVVLSALFTLICWVARQTIASIVFGTLIVIMFSLVYYKNVSFATSKRLLREPNVIFIVILSLCNWVIDTTRPVEPPTDSILGLIYMISVCSLVFLDAVKVISRLFVLAVGTIFILVNINNIYHHILGNVDYGIVLLKYSIQGREYVLMKRSTKLLIYIQVLLFSMQGIYTLVKDKKMELMFFATGNIFRKTGTASREVENNDYTTKVKLESTRNRRKETGRPTTKFALQPKMEDRIQTRNSLTIIYEENTALHKSSILLGQEAEIEEGLEWRVGWAQRGVGLSTLLGLICYIAGGGAEGKYFGLRVAFVLFAAIGIIFSCILFYKNFSFVIAKRLIKEINVCLILVLSILNLIIEILRPKDSTSVLIAIVYVVLVTAFVFMDALKVKSRMFVISWGLLIVIVNLFIMYTLVFADRAAGVILFKYKVQGNTYTFMKRSTKLSVYLQVLLFGMNGIYIIFKDRKMELMIFAMGNVYRATGTASKEVDDKQSLTKIKKSEHVVV